MIRGRLSAARSLLVAVAIALAGATTLQPVTAGAAGNRHSPFRELAGPKATSVNLFPRTSTPGPVASGFSTASGVIVFPLISRDQQVAAFGSSEVVAPPDTMLAAGPTVLLQFVNRSVSLWSKTGALLGLSNLNIALSLPAGYNLADPRVLYDAPSGRFIFSGNAADSSNNSILFVGMSKGSDPRTGFFIYQLAQTSNGELHDQPKLGVSDDKVVIGWDDFMPGSIYVGSEIWVLDKSAMLTGAAPGVASFGPSLGFLSPVPAQNLSSGAAAFVVHNGSTFASVVTITGTPAQGDVNFAVAGVVTPADNNPIPAVEPGGLTLNAGDDRFLSAVWRNGTLLAAGTVSCDPGLGLGPRDCLRIISIATGTTPAFQSARLVGRDGVDFYYPAVTLGPTGSVYFSFSVSNATVFASAALGRITPTGTQVVAIFEAGTAIYNGTLWGDYSAVSIDPVRGTVWAAAEYSPGGSFGNWGTAAAQFGP